MCKHAISAFSEKCNMSLDKTPKYKSGWLGDSVLKQDAEQRGSKKGIMTCCYYFYVTYLSVKPFPKGTTYLMTDAKLTNLEGKMNDLIKHYEVLTTDASASKLSTVLTAKNIYYYDEQKAITGLTFDKRSPEEI